MADAQPRESAMTDPVDVLVVGGGINGAGIARDLAGRGLSVTLCEQGDLASATSQWSSKMIHGGLRYLEHGALGLVRKSLIEREGLLRSAPHLIRPLRLILPHDPGLRPAWMMRIGLFLYDHLAPQHLLPASQALDLRTHPAGQALQPRFTQGFAYSDGCVDDARLVLANALDAHERGARILTRTRCESAHPDRSGWQARLQHADGRVTKLFARSIVNAAGPWADRLLGGTLGQTSTRRLRLVQGSHIVVPRLFAHDDGYLLQNPDGRVLFALPFQRDYTLLGTTDVEFTGDPAQAAITPAEIDYLCRNANRWLRTALTPAHVCWSYAGVRPLLDDEAGNPAEVTRDYRLETGGKDAAPLLTAWGGKLTTFRRLAEEAADLVCRRLGRGGNAWTRDAVLPGGDLLVPGQAVGDPAGARRLLEEAVVRACPGQPPAWVERVCAAYGSRIWQWLAREGRNALGTELAPGLHEAELAHQIEREWARCAEDVLWRRTKLGLGCNAAHVDAVERWITGHLARTAPDPPPGER